MMMPSPGAKLIGSKAPAPAPVGSFPKASTPIACTTLGFTIIPTSWAMR